MKMIAMVYYGSWQRWRYVMDSTCGSKEVGQGPKFDGRHCWLKAKVSKQEAPHGAAKIWPSGVARGGSVEVEQHVDRPMFFNY